MDKRELQTYLERYERNRNDKEAFSIAYTEYQRIVNENSNDLEAYWTFGVINDWRSRDYLNEAIKYLEKAIVLAKEQNDDFIYRKASFQLISVYSRNNQSHTSIDKYKNLLTHYPDDIYNYIFLTASYLHAGQPNDAWKVCYTAMKLEPKHPAVLLYAGEVSQELGKFDDAFAYWDECIKYDETYADARYSKAFLFRRLGKTQEAIQAFTELAEWMNNHDELEEAKWANEEAKKLKK
jgi:tetratricopeptide (TPR) repeat protein